MKTRIIVTDQFSAFHHWPKAPVIRKFLRLTHRHIFHVKLSVNVKHEDRDVEFFELKDHLDLILDRLFRHKSLGANSCEMLCVKLQQHIKEYSYDIHSIEIWEDNENGAEVIFDE